MRNYFFERARYAMERFMYGRNGQDQLSRFCYVVGLILFLISLFVRNGIFSLIVLGVWGYSLFRIYSRNLYQRQKENASWLRLTERLRKRFRLVKRQWTDRKQYRYYLCKGCGQTIRVPVGKGRIEVTCPRCRTSFRART